MKRGFARLFLNSEKRGMCQVQKRKMSELPSFLRAPEAHTVTKDTIDVTKSKVGKFTEYPLCEILASRDFTTATDIATLRVEGGTYLAKACMNFSQGTFSRRIVFPLFDPGERYAENVSELESDFPTQYEATRILLDATYKGSVDYLIASNIVCPNDTHDLLLFNRFAAGNNAYGKEKCPDGSIRPYAHFHDFLRHKVDFHLYCPNSDESTWRLVKGPPSDDTSESSFYFNDILFGGPMDFKPAPLPDHIMRYISRKIAFYSIVYLEEAVRIFNRKRAKSDLPEVTFETQAGYRLETFVPELIEKESSCRVVVCRHGQTDWNKDNRYQGHIDIPMNAAGISQARELRLRLNPLFFNKIISSDLQRAMSTTKIIAPGRNLPIESNSLIREKAAGEPLNQFRDRVLNEVRNLATKHVGQSLLLSVHGGVLKMLLVCTMGENTYTINNCSHLVIDFNNDGTCRLVGAHGVWAGGVDTCGQSDWSR
eukprot:TRINITY_DN16268_c0_g1_i1.p1 TRINITY_DN16268_c0_g1~~TRINITY_DN16268_c0_g1_i1.p1  ORF type:complete len:482 (+),score=51.98 TRINITY_DN16268_c0_g1_i1:1483-2928(+)